MVKAISEIASTIIKSIEACPLEDLTFENIILLRKNSIYSFHSHLIAFKHIQKLLFSKVILFACKVCLI